MTKAKQQELKDCPFCGNLPMDEFDGYLQCAVDYDCPIYEIGMSLKDWNTRPNPWHSISNEGNPKEIGTYLVTIKDADGRFVAPLSYWPDDGKWIAISDPEPTVDPSKVVSWMPLPDPFIEEGEHG